MEMSQEESKAMARDIAKETVKLVLRDLGIDIADDEPFELRKDFLFLREWRQTCEQVRNKGTMTVVGIIVTGLLGLLVLGFKQF